MRIANTRASICVVIMISLPAGGRNSLSTRRWTNTAGSHNEVCFVVDINMVISDTTDTSVIFVIIVRCRYALCMYYYPAHNQACSITYQYTFMLLFHTSASFRLTYVTSHLILSSHFPTSHHNTVLTKYCVYRLHCKYNIILNYIMYILLTLGAFSAILIHVQQNFRGDSL